MAKQPTIKFPRIQAGFYYVTLEGEQVGYIMCEKDGKETNWYIFDMPTPADMDIASLSPEQAIDTPDALFREAKESAKAYFLNRQSSIEDEQDIEVLNLPEADWDENGEDSWEENTITLELGKDGEEFEPVPDDLEPELVEV